MTFTAPLLGKERSKLEQLKRAFDGPHLKHKSMPLSQTDPVGTFCLIDFADKGFISWRAHKQLLSIWILMILSDVMDISTFFFQYLRAGTQTKKEGLRSKF